MKVNFLLVVIFSLILFSSGINLVYSHGLGSETLPPVDYNGKQITIEVSSTQKTDETGDDQQISIALIDFESKITLRDVTFLIKSEKGNQFLFEKEFKADNGFLVFNFVSENNDSLVIEEVEDTNPFGSLLGLESRLINVKGPKLSDGGLYKFDIEILTIGDYSQNLTNTLEFNAGISLPQISSKIIDDPDFGPQTIDLISFYDEISDFSYDANSKQFSFFMPFDWSESNIEQTSVVHEEIDIPKGFGPLLVSGYSISVNDVKLEDNVVTIDDYFSEKRLVHFTIYQKELEKISANSNNESGMHFVIKPDRDYTHLSSVTDNGQFRILVSWEPENLSSNSNGKLIFDITDVFLRNKPVSTNYDLKIIKNKQIIFDTSGVSIDSRDLHNTVEFFIPENISGIVYLNFENLGNNPLAKTSFPIVIDSKLIQNQTNIPAWIKNNAGWWADGTIDDNTFIRGIEFMIKTQIIVIPETQQKSIDSQEIPSWIKNNAGWWADGTIDDNTFVNGLQYLVANGIIQI